MTEAGDGHRPRTCCHNSPGFQVARRVCHHSPAAPPAVRFALCRPPFRSGRSGACAPGHRSRMPQRTRCPPWGMPCPHTPCHRPPAAKRRLSVTRTRGLQHKNATGSQLRSPRPGEGHFATPSGKGRSWYPLAVWPGTKPNTVGPEVAFHIAHRSGGLPCGSHEKAAPQLGVGFSRAPGAFPPPRAAQAPRG